MRRYLKEDESVQSAQSADETQKSNNQALLQQLVQMQANIDNMKSESEKRIRQIESERDNKITAIRQQMATIRQQLAQVGVDATSESVNTDYFYSKKLFESVPNNRTSEMFSVFNITQDSLKNKISYVLPEQSCMTYSKRLINYINKKQDIWQLDENNHWNGTDGCLKDKLESLLRNGVGSFSESEIQIYLDEFEKTLKTNPTFNWIFGRLNESQNYELNNLPNIENNQEQQPRIVRIPGKIREGIPGYEYVSEVTSITTTDHNTEDYLFLFRDGNYDDLMYLIGVFKISEYDDEFNISGYDKAKGYQRNLPFKTGLYFGTIYNWEIGNYPPVHEIEIALS